MKEDVGMKLMNQNTGQKKIEDQMHIQNFNNNFKPIRRKLYINYLF